MVGSDKLLLKCWGEGNKLLRLCVFVNVGVPNLLARVYC